MSKAGTQLKHGKAFGYIVSSRLHGAMTLCHSYYDEKKVVFLGGDYATVFKTRRAANRAIDRTRQEPNRENDPFRVHRLAYVRDSGKA